MAYKPGCMCIDCVYTRNDVQAIANYEVKWRGVDRYLVGVEPPHYPVPAIQYTAIDYGMYGPDYGQCIILWNDSCMPAEIEKVWD